MRSAATGAIGPACTSSFTQPEGSVSRRPVRSNCRSPLAAAERAFRRTIEIDPQNIDAKFNLALTLEEAGQTALALKMWEALLKESLSDADRTRVEHAIGLLKENAL